MVFFTRIKSTVELVFLYEEKELQELALSKMPMARLNEQAEKDGVSSKHQHGKQSVSQQDCLLLLLLAWFKSKIWL